MLTRSERGSFDYCWQSNLSRGIHFEICHWRISFKRRAPMLRARKQPPGSHDSARSSKPQSSLKLFGYEIGVHLSKFRRSARVGGIAGLGAALSLSPFLLYAGVGIMQSTARAVRPVTGEQAAGFVGFIVFLVYLLVVFGIPTILGAVVGRLAGSLMDSMRGKIKSTQPDS